MPALPLTDRDYAIRCRFGVGRYVRDLREALGLSLTELAANVGVAKETVSRIENGFANLPAPHAAAFAQALVVDPREFALMLLRWQNPWLFGMIFPNATVEPLTVTQDQRRAAERILDRRAGQQKAHRKATRRWQ